MVTNYKHHLYPKQSEFVKYRGKTGQIDVKDTIIAILAHLPGLTHDQLKDHIYHPDLNKSRFYNVSSALDALAFEGTIYKEEGSEQFYLYNDAMSHDIGKTQETMDKLLTLGVPKELVTFLSSGIIMAGEEARANAEERNYNPSDSVASTFEINKQVVETETFNPPVVGEEEVAEIKVMPDINTEQVSFSSIPHEEIEALVANPFENMSNEDMEALKLKAIEDLHAEQEAAEQEAARLEMEQIEKEQARLKEMEEKRLLFEAEQKTLAYKNKLNSIKSATSLLGLDVEIKLPDLKEQVVGTILELRPDSVLFLIVFSKEDLYPEGSIHTIYYKDNLSYKIMA